MYFHDVYYSLDTDKQGFRTFARSSHDNNKAHLTWLEENGKFSKRSNRICSSCLKYAAQRLENQTASNTNGMQNADSSSDSSSDSIPDESPISESVQSVLDLLKDGKVSEHEEIRLLAALGTKVKDKVYADTLKFKSQYKDVKKKQCRIMHKLFKNDSKIPFELFGGRNRYEP